MHTHIRPILVKAGWLIDGTGGPIRRNVLLCIRDGHIEAASPAGEAPASEADVLDCSDCTILPGLVDAHVHLALPGMEPKPGLRAQSDTGWEAACGLIASHLEDHLLHGVVAVRDGGDRAGHARRYGKAILPRPGRPLTVVKTGRAWHAPERYGRLIGRAPEDGTSLSASILQDRSPMDHVKIVHSGLNSLRSFGRETPPQFNARDLEDAVRTARGLGRRVMVHANGRIPVRDAVRSGCDSIEHGFFMGRENLARMARMGVTWVPTAGTMAALARSFPVDSTEAVGALHNLEHQVQQLREALQEGVCVALGTDAGSPGVRHGKAVAEEMGLLMHAGWSVEAAVCAATRNGAELLGLGDCLGCLVPGMPATFLTVRGDPGGIPGSLSPPLSLHVEGVRGVYGCSFTSAR